MSDKQKILIVDDKEENLFALEKVFNEIDAELIQATSGNDALVAVLNHDFAVAILDVQMPEMDGYELAELIRRNEPTKDLPIIFISAVHTDDFHIFKGYETGAVDFLTKPVDPGILLGKIGIFLQLARQKREIEKHRDNLEELVKQRTFELHKSEREYRKLYESTQDGICITSWEGEFLFVNPAYVRMLGYESEEELVGKTAADIYANPEQRERVLEELTQKGHFQNLEVEIKRKDGSTIHTLSSVTIQKDDSGNIIQAEAFVRDITARKRSEEALHQYKHIVSSSTDNLALLDRQFVYLTANRAYRDAFGLTPEQLIGKTVAEVFGEEFFNAIIKPKADRCLLGEEVNYQDWFDFPRHGRLYMSITYYPYLNDAGEVAGFVVSGRNITKRKESEEKIRRLNEDLEDRVRQRTTELEASNKELESFAYSVSHDLRAPLRGIDGFSKALLEDCSDKLCEDGKDHLNRVRSGVQRMDRLIEDMLQLSRLTRSKMRYEDIDLSAISNDIVCEFRDRDPEHHVDSSIAPDLVIRGDRSLLDATLKNLLDNAWKFTGKSDGARIEFGSEKKNGETAYFVRDNGAGFDMAYADKLFGTFQRLHGMDEFPGTGIGLSIVQRAVHRHGGRVWAEGEVDKGATFFFTIPEQSCGS